MQPKRIRISCYYVKCRPYTSDEKSETQFTQPKN